MHSYPHLKWKDWEGKEPNLDCATVDGRVRVSIYYDLAEARYEVTVVVDHSPWTHDFHDSTPLERLKANAIELAEGEFARCAAEAAPAEKPAERKAPAELVAGLYPRMDSSPEHIGHAADLACEALGYLWLATQPHHANQALPWPADSYRLIGSLAQAADTLKSIIDQVGLRQQDYGYRAGLAVDAMSEDGDPQRVNWDVVVCLQVAATRLAGVVRELRTAHKHASHLKIEQKEGGN